MATFNKDQFIPEHFYRVLHQYAGDATDMYEADDFDGSLIASTFAKALKDTGEYKNVKMFSVHSKNGEETSEEIAL